MNDLRFVMKPFDELELLELYQILHLRDLVFVVGQKITSEPEIDGADPRCFHAMLYLGDHLVGTARAFGEMHPVSVGRVAVLNEYQGRGFGTVLMTHVQEWLGARPAELHAQAHLEPWYTRLGWKRSGEDFMEAEILHTPMTWK